MDARVIADAGRSWHRGVTIVPPLLVAALPKCPICLMSLMSVVGLGSVVSEPRLLPLMLVFLAVALASLGFRSGSRRGWGPFLLAVLASAILLLGRFYFNSTWIASLGGLLLVSGSVWNAWPKQVRSAGCHC
jgi:hypothetical protein